MNRETAIRRIVKPAVHAACLGPLAWLVWTVATTGFGPTGGLGANPIEYLNRFLGDWAIRFLLTALAVTPVRLLTGQAVVVRFRRMLGLYAFFYAVLHLSSYVGLDQFFAWGAIWKDIVKRNYITVGMATFLMLLPLAATSTKGMVKRLGAKRWTKLHRVVYVAGAAACLHFYMMRKGIQLEPIIYAGILALLLGVRVVHRLRPKPQRTKTQARRA